MDSKAARNSAKAAEYKLIIEKNKELIRERVISYLKAFNHAELRAEFPLALMRINSFEMYDCLGQINDFFGESADFVLNINPNVFFAVYEKYCEILGKLAAQVLHHHIKKRSYWHTIHAFVKKLHEIEVEFAGHSNKTKGLAEKMQKIFLKKRGLIPRLIEEKRSPERRYEEKKQQLNDRISYYKELSDRAC